MFINLIRKLDSGYWIPNSFHHTNGEIFTNWLFQDILHFRLSKCDFLEYNTTIIVNFPF